MRNPVEKIRLALQKIAYDQPNTRRQIVPLLRIGAKWRTLPPGWTKDSAKDFWESLTGKNKHKVTKCIKQMDGKVTDPGAFCASLADKVMGPEWRKKKASSDPPFMGESHENEFVRFHIYKTGLR